MVWTSRPTGTTRESAGATRIASQLGPPDHSSKARKKRELNGANSLSWRYERSHAAHCGGRHDRVELASDHDAKRNAREVTANHQHTATYARVGALGALGADRAQPQELDKPLDGVLARRHRRNERISGRNGEATGRMRKQRRRPRTYWWYCKLLCCMIQLVLLH